MSIDVPPLPPGESWVIDDENDSELSAGAKGGIAAGAAVVALLVIGCMAWLYLRKRGRRYEKPLESDPVGTEPSCETKTQPEVGRKQAFEMDLSPVATGKTSYEHRVQLDRAAVAELSGDGRPAELEHV